MGWFNLTRVLGVLAIAATAVGGLAVSTARADWPMARHDVRRTGGAAGVGDLTTPGVYWRYYLGGRLAGQHATPARVGNEQALVLVAAGRVQTLLRDGTPLWTSESRGLSALVAVRDLDGDGREEIVAHSTDQVFVFDLGSGAVRWEEPIGEMGTIAAVRVADLDGDGLDDVLVQECMCCQIRSGETAVAWSFAGGFEEARRLWRLPYAHCGGANSLVIADLDGDGRANVTVSNDGTIGFADAVTGQVIATSPVLGTWMALSRCEPVAGASGATDLVCALSTGLAAAGQGHRLFRLRYAPAPPRLEVVWSVDVGERDGGLALAPGFVRDLDGDELLEIVVAGIDADGTPSTVIVDAEDGSLIAELAGEIFVGSAAVAPGRTLLMSSSTEHLSVWRFGRAQSPALELEWRIKDRRVLAQRDWRLAATQPLSGRLLVSDVDGDGVADLFVTDVQDPARVLVLDGAAAQARTLRTWSASAGADVLASWVASDDRIVLSTSDGRLVTHGPSFLGIEGSLRAGGYYDHGGWLHLPWAPIAGQLSPDAPEEVLVPDSRRSLLALDARSATNAAPPRRLWERPRTFAAALVSGDDGIGVACRRTDVTTVPTTEAVAVLGPDGAMRWEQPIGRGIVAFNDVLSANLDGDGVPDLVIQWGRLDDTAIRTTAMSGVDGTVLWTTITDAGPNRNPAGAAIYDWSGDGVDDVVFHHYGTRVLSGRDGTELVVAGPTVPAYFMPSIVDVLGDPAPEILLHGGFHPVRTLRSDLSEEALVSTDDDRPYPYGAIARCEQGAVLVTTSLRHTGRLKTVQQSGAAAGDERTVVLAGGRSYATLAEATEAPAKPGQLTSVHVHANLVGAGRPSAVVGSSDGWLYAVDPCDLTVDFAVPFDVPVGAIAFADTDGDGYDEIVVSTADGFLHGVKQAPLPAPGEVRDIDPETLIDVDVDVVATTDRLAASWDEVAGASSYEVAVAHADGGYVTDPPWQPVSGTMATIDGLALENGRRYVVAVRARSADGVSPDRLSDGVVVRLPEGPGPDGGGVEPPDAPPGGCCSAGAGGAQSLLLGVLVLGMLRRSRRRSMSPAARSAPGRER
jgi:hypothetical protein